MQKQSSFWKKAIATLCKTRELHVEWTKQLHGDAQGCQKY